MGFQSASDQAGCPRPPTAGMWPNLPQMLLQYSFIAKRGLLLSRGREDFSTQSRICLGSRARTWQIANHKRRRGGVASGTLLLSWVWDCSCKIFVSRRGGFALESGPRATFGKEHKLNFFKSFSGVGSRAKRAPNATSMHVHEASVLRSFAREWC